MVKDAGVQRLSLDELETRNLARDYCLLTRPSRARVHRSEMVEMQV